MRWIVLLAPLALVSCQSKSVSEMSFSEVRQYAAELMERCKEQGAQPGEEMQMCIDQEALADETKRRRSIATRQAIGAAISQASADYGRSVRANRPINCTSIGYGNMVRTDCY